MIGMCGNGVRGGFPGRGAGACEIALETDRAALAEVAFSTETNRSKSCGANGPSQKKNYRNGRTINVAQAQVVEEPVAGSEKHGVRRSISEERFASGLHGLTPGSKGTSFANVFQAD